MSSESAVNSTAMARVSDWPVRLGLGVALVLGSVLFVFSNFLRTQIRAAVESPQDWGHILAIPLMALYLAYLNRDRLKQTPFRTTWLGLVPIVVGVGWYMLCWVGPPAIKHHNLMGLGVGSAILGLLLLFFGPAALRWLVFPFIYMMTFGMYISERLMTLVTYKLQDIAATGSYYLFKLMTFDVSLKGNILELWYNGVNHPLNIAEACSGMRMLVAFMALGVFMAATMLSRNWQRVVLVAFAVPVAVFVNVLRVVTLGMLSLINSDLASGDFHAFIGLVWLVPAFVIYLSIMWVLRRVVVDRDSKTVAKARGEPDRVPFAFDRRARVAVMVACGALVVSGLGFRVAVSSLRIYLMKQAVPLRSDLSRIPVLLGDWSRQGDDIVFDEATLAELGTSDYLLRKYGTEDGDGLLLHIAYYTDQIDAVPHVPERCWTAGGRRPIGGARHLEVELDQTMWLEDLGEPNRRTGEAYQLVAGIDLYTQRRYTVRMPIGDVELRVLVFQEGDDSNAFIIGGYFFLANGAVTARAEEIRLLAFDRTDEYAYYCKVEFSMGATGEDDVERYLANVSSLLTPLLPQLMRSLPDWAEVEQGLYPVNHTGVTEAEKKG